MKSQPDIGESLGDDANMFESKVRGDSADDTLLRTQQVSKTYKRYEFVKKTRYFQKNKKAIYE